MASFDKNSDLLCNEFPPEKYYKLKGIRYRFEDESSYVEPVSLDDFKEYAEIDGATYDGDIEDILKGARRSVEQWLQLSLGVRTVKFTALECPTDYMLMWGEVDTISTDNFTHFNGILREGGKEIEVEYTTTNYYGTFEDIQLAIKKQAWNMYENKDKYLDGGKQIVSLVDEVKELLAKYRNITLP